MEEGRVQHIQVPNQKVLIFHCVVSKRLDKVGGKKGELWVGTAASLEGNNHCSALHKGAFWLNFDSYVNNGKVKVFIMYQLIFFHISSWSSTLGCLLLKFTVAYFRALVGPRGQLFQPTTHTGGIRSHSWRKVVAALLAPTSHRYLPLCLLSALRLQGPW